MIAPYIDSIILGIVEGLTEFIPVSSTGHLIAAESILGRTEESAKVFDVFIQIGAILAVVWARRIRIIHIIAGLPKDRVQQLLALKIIVAFLPAAIAGVLFYPIIKAVLFSPWVVGITLITGGIFMIFAEKFARQPDVTSMESMSVMTALKIGLCQILSLIPGVSRAGASIVGARLLGVEMRTAAEFSFFLAIPTIFGAAVYDLYKSRDLLSPNNVPEFAIGTIAAFSSALIVVKWLIDFVGKHGFKPFGYYRIVAGIILIALLYTGTIR